MSCILEQYIMENPTKAEFWWKHDLKDALDADSVLLAKV